MNSLKLLLIVSVVALYSCYSTTGVGNLGSNYGHGMPSEPGKCYAKCLLPDEYETIVHRLPVYTGEEAAEEVSLDSLEIVVKSASSKWEKRMADRNCLSADPNDCMVWCLIETPEEVKYLTVVRDTTQSDNYEWTDVKTRVLKKEGGMTDWVEVVCSSDLTPRFYKKIQTALIERGYNIGEAGADGKPSQQTQRALIKFQRDHELRVGQLDFVSLEALGIKI